MRVIDIYYQSGDPGVYHFVTNRYDPTTKDFELLIMPDDGRWPYARLMMGEYRPGEDNTHLGEQVCRQELGRVVLGRLARLRF